MGDSTITQLWVPVVVLAHFFCFACLVLGPLKLLLHNHGGVRGLLRRRRGSVAGKLPKVNENDGEEDDALDISPARPQAQQGTTVRPAATAAITSGRDQQQRADKPAATVQRIQLEWQQICCTYDAAHGKIVVLQDVWGQAEPGEMQVCAAWTLPALGRQCLMQLVQSSKLCFGLHAVVLFVDSRRSDSILCSQAVNYVLIGQFGLAAPGSARRKVNQW